MSKAIESITTRRAFVQSTSTAALALGAVAIPVTVLPKAGQAAEPDPIFAAIETQQRVSAWAEANLGRCSSPEEADGFLTPTNDAILALFTTRPTTLAGVAAILEYVNQPAEPNWPQSLLAERQEWVHTEMGDAANAFLSMIADVVRELAAKGAVS
jgi:hypothetical protein